MLQGFLKVIFTEQVAAGNSAHLARAALQRDPACTRSDMCTCQSCFLYTAALLPLSPVFNVKVTEDKGTTAEGQPQNRAESLCFCSKPAFGSCPGCQIPPAALCGSCSSCAQAAPCSVSQRFPSSWDVTCGSDGFGSPRQVLHVQVGLIC